MTIGFKANNDGSAAIQVGGTDRVTLSAAGVVGIPAGITANVTGNASTATALSTASGSAPSYAARAWVNFDGSAAGTFAGGTSTVTRVAGSTTATVTTTNDHGLITGNNVNALTGVAAGLYAVTVTGARTFTITTVATTALTAASITFAENSIRASGNVSSVVDNGVGDYTVNFSTSMADANYGFALSCQGASGVNSLIGVEQNQLTNPTASAIRIILKQGSAALDRAIVCVSIFR
jgi:hypothetical protein